MTWYIGITNDMGSIQYVMIKVKLGNTTQNPPERDTPAQMSTIIEYQRFLANNETYEMPFVWAIGDAEESYGTIRLTEFVINDKILPLNGIESEYGRNFRFVFELWTFDPEDQEFIYGWESGGKHKSAWLQLWFNTTIVFY